MTKNAIEDTAIAPNTEEEEIRAFLSRLDFSTEAGRSYMQIHEARIVRTLTLAPRAKPGERALELGCYMQMAPVLAHIHGYTEVVGSYLGPRGGRDTSTATINGAVVMRCHIDLFNVETDRFPYNDKSFSLVLCCELIEHLLRDPAHMLAETHRVLADDGAMVITTPNTASYTSIARVLTNTGNPQIYSLYPAALTESPHVREYTGTELRELVCTQGFEIEHLFTEKIEGCNADEWVKPLIQPLGFPTGLRGEQIYCVARKRSGRTVDRYPRFLYEKRT